jgi:hypothetical protein
VLSLKVPPFDVLTGQDAPYVGFGETNVVHSAVPGSYLETVSEAHRRISDVFGIRSESGLERIQWVEGVVARMWADGWNPSRANVNLFVTDFGCVTIEGLRQDLGGTLVLRSEKDLSHASVWWKEKAIEAFPFHVIYKRLISNEGQSLTHFFNALKEMLRSQ